MISFWTSNLLQHPPALAGSFFHRPIQRIQILSGGESQGEHTGIVTNVVVSRLVSFVESSKFGSDLEILCGRFSELTCFALSANRTDAAARFRKRISLPRCTVASQPSRQEIRTHRAAGQHLSFTLRGFKLDTTTQTIL